MAYPWNLIVKGRDTMLQKLKSKRGFTIVEVMVAFVIFAIMAGMVTMIVNQAILQKRHNKEVAAQLTEQENKYYLNTQDYTYTTSDGKLRLNFTGGSAVDIDYEYGDPNGDDADVELRLKYLIGKYGLLTKSSSGSSGGGSSAGGSSVMSRLDSRIYGTAKIDSVSLKAESRGAVDGGYLYLFKVTPSAPDLEGTQYEYHAQVKIVMPSTVVDYGYTGVADVIENKSKGANKDYRITLPTPTTICIGSNMPRGWGDYMSHKRKSFVANTNMGFWVILPEELDISDLNKVFGTSGTGQTSNKTGDTYTFTPYVEITKDDSGNEVSITHVNIFGAFPLEESDPGTTEA